MAPHPLFGPLLQNYNQSTAHDKLPGPEQCSKKTTYRRGLGFKVFWNVGFIALGFDLKIDGEATCKRTF
jgi:hypothetical protein